MVSPAALLSFAGVTSTALSPALVLFVTVVLPKPELVILAIGSAFMWLLSIFVCAAFWWATSSAGDVLRILLVVPFGVGAQEASRYLTYWLHMKMLHGLQSIGLQPTRSTSTSLPATAPAAVANGVGIGVVQMLVMYGDVAVRTLQPGSLYTEACADLSLFAVGALCSLGMLLMNVLLSMLGWTTAYPERSPKLLAAIVGLHLLASASTSLNSTAIVAANGCVLALPCMFAAVFLTGLLTVYTVSAGLTRRAFARTLSADRPD